MTAQVSIDLDLRLFSLTAVKKALYRMGDRCHFEVEHLDDETLRVKLSSRVAVADLAYLAGELRTEVLDQDLREIVARETESVRNLIVAQAFSKLALLDPVGESADYRDDPLGISKADPPL